jgi:hypothetical protein
MDETASRTWHRPRKRPIDTDFRGPLLERLRALLGGREATMEAPYSPYYQAILDFLETRFGPAAKELEVELKAVKLDRLSDLVKFAAKCRSLASFRKRLLS